MAAKNLVKDIKAALENGKIVALMQSEVTGEITFSAFDNDGDLQDCIYAGADTPAKYEAMPDIVIIRGGKGK